MTKEFRDQIRVAIVKNKDKYPSISDAKYAKMLGISPSIYSRLKNGETERIVSDNFWLENGQRLQVGIVSNEMKFAETTVYVEIKNSIEFCKENSKAIVMVDNNGIGKTRCAKRVLRNLRNSFYIDCSQARTKTEFIRYFAKTVGIDNTGRLIDVKNALKYHLYHLGKAVVVLDDFGYVNMTNSISNVLLELMEIYNYTEKKVGWLMIGDYSLEEKLSKGVRTKKTAFKALYDRFTSEFVHFAPTRVEDKQAFYKQLIGDVASVNVNNKALVNKMVTKCLGQEKTLRYLETLIMNN